MGGSSSLRQVTTLRSTRWRRHVLHAAACAGVVVCAGVGVATSIVGVAPPPANPSVDVGTDAPVITADAALQASTQNTSVVSSGSASGAVAPDQPPRDSGPPRITPREYTVQVGDTVRDIAQRFSVSNETIIWENDLIDPDNLVPGQTLEILPFTGLVHEVRPGDTLVSVANTYEARLDDVIAVNHLHEPFIIVVGQKLAVPGGYRPLPRKAAPPDESSASAGTSSGTTVQAPLPPNDQAAASSAPAKRLPVLGNTPQEQFIGSIALAAVASEEETGVPASVTIAQAILESYWGSSRLSREASNYFGIKAQTQPGTAGVVWFDVWEVVGGRSVVQHQPFRAYHTLAESFLDHGHFLQENGRYALAMATTGNAREFARALARAGYATDPAYASKLIALMDRYDLYRYD